MDSIRILMRKTHIIVHPNLLGLDGSRTAPSTIRINDAKGRITGLKMVWKSAPILILPDLITADMARGEACCRFDDDLTKDLLS